MKIILNKIRVLSFAKLQAILLSLLGLIAGIIYSVGGLIYDIFTVGLNFGSVLAFLALIGMPILFAIFGFILGLIEIILFNLFARWLGNVDLFLEQKDT